jgi:hypothetical protein
MGYEHLESQIGRDGGTVNQKLHRNGDLGHLVLQSLLCAAYCHVPVVDPVQSTESVLSRCAVGDGRIPREVAEWTWIVSDSV